MASKAEVMFVLAGKRGIIGRVSRHLLRLLYGCDVSAGAKFGTPPKIHHPVGIVIGSGVTIGRNTTIYQGVTVGADRAGRYPTIGHNVVIYPNSTIFGGVNIGDNAIIGAHALINSDVPPGAVVRVTPTPIETM